MILDVFVTQVLIPNGQCSEITHLINASLLEEQVKTELIQSYTTKVRSTSSSSQNNKSSHPGAESGETSDGDRGANQLLENESKLGRSLFRIKRVGAFCISAIHHLSVYSNTITPIRQTCKISSQSRIYFISLVLQVLLMTLWLEYQYHVTCNYKQSYSFSVAAYKVMMYPCNYTKKC